MGTCILNDEEWRKENYSNQILTWVTCFIKNEILSLISKQEILSVRSDRLNACIMHSMNYDVTLRAAQVTFNKRRLS